MMRWVILLFCLMYFMVGLVVLGVWFLCMLLIVLVRKLGLELVGVCRELEVVWEWLERKDFMGEIL